MVFLSSCFSGVFVVMFLRWCFCGVVQYWSTTGVMLLWWCFSGAVV